MSRPTTSQRWEEAATGEQGPERTVGGKRRPSGDPAALPSTRGAPFAGNLGET